VTHIRISERDGVAVLTADRPPANAMDLELLEELVGAVERLAADLPPALVLAGRAGFFSAGVDLKALPAYRPAEQRRIVEGINRMALDVYSLPCPVVCARSPGTPSRAGSCSRSAAITGSRRPKAAMA